MDRIVLKILRFFSISACVVAFTTSAIGATSTYPIKPIRIVVLNSPGSGADVLTRTIAAKITEGLGQSTVIDNRAGGGGNAGMEIVARAVPDGYTLLMITSQQAIVVGLYDRLNYDIQRDYATISLIGTTPLVLVTNLGIPVSSISELISFAKLKPGQINYGSPGSGSSGHLAAELFKHKAGVNIVHVPYKGATPALTDTLAGQVQLTLFVAPIAMPVVRAGKLRALGVTTAKRSALAPDVPAIAETLPGYEWSGWYGLVAPAGTPRDVVAKLNAVQLNALKTPEFSERLFSMGTNVVGSSPEEYSAHIRKEVLKMREAIKISGARAD